MEGLADIVHDIKTASANITAAETSTKRSLAELKQQSFDLESKYEGLESSVNDLWKKAGRPGAEGGGCDTDERKDAADFAASSTS